jgi:hypothetical protein
MPANTDPSPDGEPFATEYYYQRQLGLRELLPAAGIGVAAGLLGFYVARVLLERTPLLPRPHGPPVHVDRRIGDRRLRGRPGIRGRDG